MSSEWSAPEGFVVERRGRAALVADRRRLGTFRDEQLDDPDRWIDLLSGEAASPGRGRTATWTPSDGGTLRLKRLRRGGLAGPLWRDRMFGARRLLDNLRVPLEARRRGVATPRVPALMLVSGPPGLYRGWLAVEELSGTVDLASAFASTAPPSSAEMSAVMRFVRLMHDAGVEHRDLNLGNLLIRRSEGAVETFVIDLDGARLHEGPLAFRPRRQALRRFERSYVKCRRHAAEEPVRRRIYEAYAGEDEDLATRLGRGMRAGRFWIRLHALGWRR